MLGGVFRPKHDNLELNVTRSSPRSQRRQLRGAHAGVTEPVPGARTGKDHLQTLVFVLPFGRLSCAIAFGWPIGRGDQHLPPTWGPHRQRGNDPYSLRSWIRDVTWWNQMLPGDWPIQRRMAAVIRSLEGAAYAVGNNFTVQETIHGGVFNGRHREPMELLMLRLDARFGQQEDELRRIADDEFLGFRPHPNDTFVELFTKYELARIRHRAEGERVFTWQEHTRRMLHFAEFPESVLISLLNHGERGINFRLPTTEDEYQDLMLRMQSYARFLQGRHGNLMADIIHGRDAEIEQTMRSWGTRHPFPTSDH